MKFAEHLGAHITPEWRKQYINYEQMKSMLYTAVEEAPSMVYATKEEVDKHYAQFHDYFLQFSHEELKRINSFYAEKLAEANRKFLELRGELYVPGKRVGKGSSVALLQERAQLPARKMRDLKLAFSEFYLNLVLLQNYQNLNFTGFRKILKKHDKLLNVNTGAAWRVEFVETAPFYTDGTINKLISETEQTFTQSLEDGNRQKAMKRLRVPPFGEKQTPWITFKVGLFSGCFITLCAAAILSGMFRHYNTDRLIAGLKLYRGSFLLVEFLCLISINVYGWRSSGVNHVLIFELDPRNHLTEQHLMELAAVVGVSWTISVLVFLYSSSIGIPPFVSPIAFVIVVVLFTFNPFKTFRYEARFWLIRLMGRMISAPFFYVGFADFWLADQLNSLVTAFTDTYYFICFYASNDILTDGDIIIPSGVEFDTIKLFVSCIPAWIRLAQCLRRYRDTREAFPHLANAGKYTASLVATVFLNLLNSCFAYYPSVFENPYFYGWFISTTISSTYAYIWDVKMDWGLFDSSATDNKFLREETVYSSTAFYYFAIIEDFVLRFFWIVMMYVVKAGYITNSVSTYVTAPLEVFRRFIWNYFRLENEHLNNCGKFRAVRDISIAPIDSSDPVQILRMMDEEDGVINRKKKKVTGKKNVKEDKRQLLKADKMNDTEVTLWED